MNCSISANIPNACFLTGNLGASIFMIVYIGLYGTGIIVYFTCRFVTDVRDNHENEISSEFFTTFHHINERQEIYNRLKNREWLKKVYHIYYSDGLLQAEVVDQKAEQCSKKYEEKIQHLQLRHAYYVTETSTPTTLTTITLSN